MGLLRMLSRANIFRLCALAISVVALLSSLQPGTVAGQTTVAISSTVETPGIDRPGINLGGIAGYGSQQLIKSLNYVNGGYFPGTYAATTYACSQGGSNTTTSWYNNITGGYPANFWAGATFVAINSATGTSYGSGTITASTANNGGTGITFTLSPAISTACDPSQDSFHSDVLIVRLTKPNTLLSPYQVLGGHVCSNAAWNTADTSPASTNTQQSLQMPSGCGLTFYIDATIANRTNTNSGLASQQVNAINLNGSYNATFKAKCLVSGCSVNFNLGRGGANYAGSTVSPSAGGPGAGWTTYTYPFNASETGPQGQNIIFNFGCTGTCLLQDADVIEGSTLPGNTTVFRDAVVYELQKLHPGSIRYMDPSQWCSDVADEIAATGNRRWCGVSESSPGGVGQPLGYNDVLTLANFIGSDVVISVGQFTQPSDWTTLVNWLSSSGWISTYAAAGHTIYLEDGNEAWNFNASGTIIYGVGTAYGYMLGPNMAAAKAATGYNPGVIKLVGDSFAAGAEGYGTLGWVQNVLSVAQGTPNGLPDFVDVAPYTLNYLGNFSTSGGNVATTGAPFLDQWAENANIDSVTSPPAYTQSMYLNQQYVKANFGVNTLVYEVNASTTSGVVASQLQLDQIDASVGNALSTAEHVLLMQRDSQVTGPIHVFTLAEPYTGYGCNGCNGQVMPLWGANLFMATGPGQTAGVANVDRPLAIALQVINNAIGANSNLMSVTQTGTPTFSYPGGQDQNGSHTILPNSAVPYVNCFAYSDGQGNWTTICFNNNLTTAASVNLTGAGAPTGSVSETVFPGPSNVITDHNENTYLGGNTAPVVALPSATTTSGTSYTIPTASMITLAYNVSGIPTLTTPTFSPGTGNYSATQTVTIGFPSGSTGCVGINTTPTAPTAGTCGAGGTTYTGPITVSASQTVSAIATEVGIANSTVGRATYTITGPTAATPTFSPAAGTYTSSQSVTISDATAGATIYYTTNGSTPTTSSSVYGGAITVAASETVEAIAVKAGYTTSAVATAAYYITNGVAPAVSTACYQGSGASSLTLGPIDTSGSSAVAIVVASFNNILNVTDNKGNGNATGLTASSGGSPNNQIFYWQNPNVGSGHTITVNGGGGLYGSACVFVMSGINGVYSGAQSANAAGYGSASCQTGSIIPANGPEIVITGFGVYTPGGIPTLDSSYTIGAYQPGTGGSAFGEAAGYIIQSSGAATNPTWNWGNNATSPGCVIAAFGGGSGIPRAATPTFTPAAGTYTTSQSVAINDATSGTTIYYTTNGTTPTTSSSVYGGPITVTSSETLEAIAVETGYNTSTTAIAAYTIAPILPTPTFSPAGGTYTSSQSVSINDTQAGTTFYYTTNGTTPTTSSNVYGGPITVSSSETLEAIAVEAGYTTSAAATATFIIKPVLPAPTFSPPGGTYTTLQPVSMSDATAGTTIYYTTDGTTPTTSSSVYGSPITVSASETVEAIAVEAGYTNSPVTSATYNISTVLPAPTFSPVAGPYTPPQPSTSADYGLHIHGDSISVPAGAGCSVPALCYNALLDAEVGWNTAANANDSSSGDESEDMNVKVFTNENPTATNNPIQTTLIGTNDVLVVGASTGYLTTFAQVQAATHAWLALANTSKIAGSTGSVSGTCSNDPTYPFISGKQCTASNSTVTWSNVSAPNGVIYLWYRAFQTSTGTATCTVDSSAATDTLTSSTTLTAQALVGLPTGHSVTNDVQLARFAGYSTASPHTVACTNTNTFTYVGLGLPPATRYPGLNSPKVAMGGVIYQQSDTSSAVTAAYNNQSSAVAALLYGDNLNVLWFNPRLYLDANCSMGSPRTAGCPESLSPPVHPSDTGYRQLTNGFEDTLNIVTSPASVPVTISDAASGTTIYYTTNGATPTTSSTVYSGPIRVLASETVEAIAVKNGYTTSAASSTAYTISNNTVLATPTFTPAGGTYATSQSVTINAAAGTTVYYTTNGTTPTTSSSVYGGAITVSASETLQAIAVESGYTTSPVSTAVYSINSVLPAPTFSVAAGTYTTSQSVSISDATAGTTIYYTTNGTTPTTSSSVYGGAITVSSSQTLQAIAVETGYTTSTVATAVYTINPVLPAPSFSPLPGTYTTSQSVTISDATAGTTIYYTTNGTTPTTSSSVYSGAITVSSSQTVQAIAVETGYTTSTVATAVYTINPVLPAPSFSPAGGTYTGAQSVSISDATAGTTIYYTTNGSVPTASSSIYSGAVNVSSSQTLQAIAAKSGFTNSPVASASYTINIASSGPTVTTSCYQGSASSSLTLGPINTSGANAIAIVVASFNNILTVTDNRGNGNATGLTAASGNSPNNQIFYWQNPSVGSGHTITVNGGGGLYGSACVFVMSGVSGTYSGAQNANSAGYGSSTCQAGSITPATGPQVVITGFGVYSPSGIPTLDSSYTVGAYQAGSPGSAYGEAAGYIIQPSGVATNPKWNWGNNATTPGCVIAAFGGGTGTPTAATPTFTPPAGTYTTSQTVTITDTTPGTTIYYTTNGTTPTTSSSVYGGAITASASETLEAIAVETGYTNSAVATAAYTISPLLPTPTFTPAAGTYATSQSVSISDATAGTTIYYTTNGTTPTTSSSVYGGAITVSSTETLQAIAVETGYTTSAAGTAAYTINPILPAPTFSVAAGTYTTSQSVSISDATAGTTIYYTTNGSTPTTSSSVYGGAITVSASQTLEAIAVETGYTTSPVATAVYTINPVLAAPVFSPAAGTYTTSQSVSISDATAGTTIYYTTNGSTPTTSSSVYGGAITVSASQTLEAIAVKTGYTTSAVATAAYTITTGGGPLVSTACYQGSSSSSLTLGPINTAGANAIAIVVASFNNILNVTDNKGNGNATGLTAASGNSPNNQIFYWQTPNVGSGHTITINGGAGLYASACVFVMSGVSGVYSGAQNASSAGYGSSSCQAGITPASGPKVVIAGFGVYAPSGAPTLDSSYTVGAYQAGTPGSAFGEATGYMIQPSGAATNPKWNWGNNATSPSCVIAAFGG